MTPMMTARSGNSAGTDPFDRPLRPHQGTVINPLSALPLLPGPTPVAGPTVFATGLEVLHLWRLKPPACHSHAPTRFDLVPFLRPLSPGLPLSSGPPLFLWSVRACSTASWAIFRAQEDKPNS